MARFVLSIIMAALVSLPAVSQPTTTSGRPLTKEEKKALDKAVKERKKELKKLEKERKEELDQLAHDKAVQAIRDHQFVLLVESVNFTGGPWANGLSTDRNFIVVQGDIGAIQTATSYRHPGPNGLGGFTSSGTVRELRIQETKKGDLIADFSIVGTTANSSVSITLYHGSDKATAMVSHNIGPGSFTMRGQLVPYHDETLKLDR